MLEEKPRVRQYYKHRWFWFDLRIAHTQIKVLTWQQINQLITRTNRWEYHLSSTHTHTQEISFWNELSRTSFYLPTLQVVVWLNQLAQGYPTRILGEGVVYKKNQLNHELNIIVRGQPGDTSEKIFGKSRTTDMSLSSRTILLFRAEWYDKNERGLDKILTHQSKCAPGRWTR